MSNRIEQAAAFAEAAHGSIDHRRKYTGVPYTVHTRAVAARVAACTDDEDMICAAHLHDVLEDVAPSRPEFGQAAILQQFGFEVLRLVVELTDVYTKRAYPDLNREVRKRAEAERLGRTSDKAKTIKLADLVDNGLDIVANDPHFAGRYLREKRDLVLHLEAGDLRLLTQAHQILVENAQHLTPKP